MKFSSQSIKTTLLTLTGLAAGALLSQAALVVPPATGDVFLAFRATGGQGSGSSYIVKLGQHTLFTSTGSTASFDVSILGSGGPGTGNIGADLGEIYGANWASRPDLLWAVFGSKKTGDPIVYSTRLRPRLATVSQSWEPLDNDSRTNISSQINSVLTTTRGYIELQATDNSTVAVLQTNAGEPSSYYYQVATPGTTDFGSLSTWKSIEGGSASGVKNTVLDFYRVASSQESTLPNVTRLGNFTISTSGVVTFSGNSIPSPTVDSDGDGFTDEYEVYAGTDRYDASSFFHVDSLQWTVTGAEIKFATTPLRNYQIQYSENLSNSWQVIKTILGTPSGSPVDYIDIDPVRSIGARGFYRARIVP